jgi:hypothetical protein
MQATNFLRDHLIEGIDIGAAPVFNSRVEMQMNAKFIVGLLLVHVVAMCGCSPQKTLAQRLKDADRVIFACNVTGYEDLTITVTGEDVNKIGQAIAAGKKEKTPIKASPSFRLEFFKGGVRLGTVTNSVGVFWIGQTPYNDSSGTLQQLYEKCREEHPPKLSR